MGALAAMVPVLEAPDCTFGRWSDKREATPGVMEMPYYIFSPQAEQFRAAVGKGGWVKPFDWGKWLATPEGQVLQRGGAAIERADVEQLSKLLTAIIRSDRFTEGSIAGAFESGLLTAIARRAAVLRDELPEA